MKKLLLSFAILFATLGLMAQPFGYYNGIEGQTGTTLKSTLHGIIDGHTEYHYSTVKQILKNSDEDPNNPDNIILLYTGWSIPKGNFASVLDSLNHWNREHVWAKSHGDFGTDPGAGTDAHAIRPVDNTVNSARSYYDFDNGGTEYYDAGIATGCYKDGDSWEPRNEVKGDVARMIFYMATRYEGTNGELDLQVVDYVGTFPQPKHGKLSTLLQWNTQDPPDAFERNRNDVVHNWQQNRNPFVDYPELADLIWNNGTANPIQITNVSSNPAQPEANDLVTISANIAHTGTGSITAATLYWGLSWGGLTNQVSLTNTAGTYSGQIPGQAASTKVYLKIVAESANEEKSYVASYQVANEPFTGTLTNIYDIQGQTAITPYQGQTVSTGGVVTAAFGADFFLQSGTGPWNGVFVYNSGYFPAIGDSIIVTAEVDEYYDLTELKNVSDYYYISSNNPLPDPVVLATGDVWDEQYEAVLVRVENAECVRDTSYGMWFVNDGSGDCLIHNSAVYSFNYSIGSFYDITGPLKYDFGEFKIELRGADDVEASVDVFPPHINDVQLFSATVMHVNFTEDLDQTTAETLSNYQINNGVTVSNAVHHSFDKKKVILTLAGLQGGTYTLTVDGVEDLAGNAISLEQIDFTSSYSLEELVENSFVIYPNPANEVLFVEAQNLNLDDAEIKIYDFTGRTIDFSISNKAGSIKVDVATFESGVYFIEIKSGESTLTSKFVK